MNRISAPRRRASDAAWGKELKGLALPVDVLENIYYKNAVQLYPRIKEVLEGRAYAIE